MHEVFGKMKKRGFKELGVGGCGVGWGWGGVLGLGWGVGWGGLDTGLGV